MKPRTAEERIRPLMTRAQWTAALTQMRSTEDHEERHDLAIRLMDEYLETGDDALGRALDQNIALLLRDPRTKGHRSTFVWIAEVAELLHFETNLAFYLFATENFGVGMHAYGLMERASETLNWRALLRIATDTLPYVVSDDDKKREEKRKHLMGFCRAPVRVTFHEGGRHTPIWGEQYRGTTTEIEGSTWSLTLEFYDKNEKPFGVEIPAVACFFWSNAPHKVLTNVGREFTLLEGPKSVATMVIAWDENETGVDDEDDGDSEEEPK